MIFKLVLGLGNNSYSQIEQLCEIYSIAGADIFDLSPNVDSIAAAIRGIECAGLKREDFKLCVSFGVKGDIHAKKARVINCTNCGACLGLCPQEALALGVLDKNKCIGCGKCKNDCIEFYDNVADIASLSRELKDKIDMVELHISTPDRCEIEKNWQLILDNFDCRKSICLDRSKFDETFIKKLLALNPDRTIIQADGIPMSGAEGVESTIPAVEHALLYKDYDADIFISGGTNNFTRALADKMGARAEGITIGTFARRARTVAEAEMIVNSVRKPNV